MVTGLSWLGALWLKRHLRACAGNTPFRTYSLPSREGLSTAAPMACLSRAVFVSYLHSCDARRRCFSTESRPFVFRERLNAGLPSKGGLPVAVQAWELLAGHICRSPRGLVAEAMVHIACATSLPNQGVALGISCFEPGAKGIFVGRIHDHVGLIKCGNSPHDLNTTRHDGARAIHSAWVPLQQRQAR